MTPQVDVMLFVDMPAASAWQCEQFGDQMREREWRPVADQCNTFRTSYAGQASDSAIVRASEADAKLAAEASGITHWEGVCVLSG